MLSKDGHTVELQKIEDWNVVELIVNGELVYKCDINELDYGKKNHGLNPTAVQSKNAVCSNIKHNRYFH